MRIGIQTHKKITDQVKALLNDYAYDIDLAYSNKNEKPGQ